MRLNNRTPKILSRSFGTNFFLFLFVSISICFFSCNESSVVGLDVQPTTDLLNVGFQDTTSLITKTIAEDTLRTDEEILATALIGKYIDPVFGETSSSLYTQLALSTNITTFGAQALCDSIVVWLAYDPGYYYGSRERKQQTLKVLEVTEAIPAGAKYSNKTVSTGTDHAGAYNFIPRPTDSVMVAGVKSKPQLRIPLNINFGQGFLDNPANLANNTTFQTAMKGLHFTTEGTALASGEGNILNFKMAESKMTLYYNYVGKTQFTNVDSVIYTKYDFSFAGTRFLHFTHNYTTNVDPSLAMQLSATPPAQNELLFLQSMAGVKVKIEMPALKNWVDSGAISINKAELIIKVDQSGNYPDSAFAVPTKLFLSSIGDDGKGYFLPDINVGGGNSFYNGIYNPITLEYRFNIAKYLQQVLTGSAKNNGLFLIASSTSAEELLPLKGNVMRANRVVVGGGKNTGAYQMKLNITYTKLH